MPTLDERIEAENGGAAETARADRAEAEVARLTAERDALQQTVSALTARLHNSMEKTFADAFAEARAAGLKQFTWRGRPYHTRTLEEDHGR